MQKQISNDDLIFLFPTLLYMHSYSYTTIQGQKLDKLFKGGNTI